MKYIKIMYRGFLVFLLYTAIGQMHSGGESLENKYHRFVNSEKFQSAFWTLAKPATWAYSKTMRFIHEHTGDSNIEATKDALAR